MQQGVSRPRGHGIYRSFQSVAEITREPRFLPVFPIARRSGRGHSQGGAARRLALWLQQCWTAHQNRHCLGSRGRDVEAVGAVEELHAARRIWRMRSRQEKITTGASWPWNLSTVPMRIPGRPARRLRTWALYGATIRMSSGSSPCRTFPSSIQWIQGQQSQRDGQYNRLLLEKILVAHHVPWEGSAARTAPTRGGPRSVGSPTHRAIAAGPRRTPRK